MVWRFSERTSFFSVCILVLFHIVKKQPEKNEVKLAEGATKKSYCQHFGGTRPNYFESAVLVVYLQGQKMAVPDLLLYKWMWLI